MVDYHIHSTFSDGEESPEDLIRLASEQGLEAIAITDHFDANDPNYGGKSMEQLLRHFERIRASAAKSELTVYCGVETGTDMEGHFAQEQELLACCDIIITSPHYLRTDCEIKRGEWFNDAYWEAYRSLLLNVAAGPGNVLGHPEGYLPIGPLLLPGTTYEERKGICRSIAQRYFDEEFVDQLACALKSSGKACELHGATDTPRECVVKRMGEHGVRFSLGSDTHAAGLLGKNERGETLIRKYHLKQYHPKQKERAAW